jgi:putative ABC transport system permease protein
VRRGLADGGVVLGTHLAQRAKLGVGDTIVIKAGDRAYSLRVVGTATEYHAAGLVVFMDRDRAQRFLGVEGVDAFLIKAKPQALPAVEAKLQTLCRQRGLLLQSFAEVSQLAHETLAGLVGGLWVLLALQFIVAGIGIANTLTMNVLEQTRELGLLRAVGMTQRQLQTTILVQAAIIGLVGVATGAVGGVGVAYLFNVCTMPLLGLSVELVLRWPLVLGCCAAALAIAMAAALLPALRAARLDIVEALQYE